MEYDWERHEIRPSSKVETTNYEIETFKHRTIMR